MAIKYGRPIESRVRVVPAEAKARAELPPLELTTRMRRNRKSEWSRRMVCENVLTSADLIWPLFIVDGARTRVPVDSMPGVERLSVDEAVREAARAAALDIPCLALFPYTDPILRDADGSEALNPDNLISGTSFLMARIAWQTRFFELSASLPSSSRKFGSV